MKTIIDTTKVEIISKQLDNIAQTLNQHSNGISAGEVALIASFIGASAAILSQVVIFLLTRAKEQSNLKKEFIAEERRISYLITEYYKELIMFKVHKNFYYKTATLFTSDSKYGDEQYEKSVASNQKAIEVLTKIRITTSDYFKVITHFINLVGESQIINEELEKIKSFEAREATKFEEINNYNDLLSAEKQEEADLQEIYKFYSKCFDTIYSEMKKKLK